MAAPAVVTPARFERATPRLGIWCSIQLSYGAHKVEGVFPIQKAVGTLRYVIPHRNRVPCQDKTASSGADVPPRCDPSGESLRIGTIFQALLLRSD